LCSKISFVFYGFTNPDYRLTRITSPPINQDYRGFTVLTGVLRSEYTSTLTLSNGLLTHDMPKYVTWDTRSALLLSERNKDYYYYYYCGVAPNSRIIERGITSHIIITFKTRLSAEINLYLIGLDVLLLTLSRFEHVSFARN
jgi:hypothetical protein